MSVRQMLSTGYVYMPDFGHRIRGHACRSCDSGVIKFKDVITLIDLMDDSDAMVSYRAKWAFTFLINRHLLQQFYQHSTSEQAIFAINAIRYLYTKHPDKYLLSKIYHILYTQVEYKQQDLLKQAPLNEARAIFGTFCNDVWGEKLTALPPKTHEGKFIIKSHDNKQFITTTSSWVLYKHTIIEHTPGPSPPSDPNIIPIACFDKKDDIYQLLDYKLSVKAAALNNDRKGLNNLISRYPEALKYMAFIKDRYINHNNYIHGGSVVSFLIKAYDEIIKENGSHNINSSTDTTHLCGNPKFPDAKSLLTRLPDKINNRFKSFIKKHPHASQGATINYHNKNRDLILTVNITDRKPDAAPFYVYTEWNLTTNAYQRKLNTLYNFEQQGLFYKNITERERAEIKLLNYNSALYGHFTYLHDQRNTKKFINKHHHYVVLGMNSYMISINTYHSEPVAKKEIIKLSNTILGFLLEGIDGR